MYRHQAYLSQFRGRPMTRVGREIGREQQNPLLGEQRILPIKNVCF